MDEPIEEQGSDGQPSEELVESAREALAPDDVLKPASSDYEADEMERGSRLPYPVVGIGASAGGVEACIELFSALTDKTGMAFVVVPHLLADHKSHMVEILARHTSMPVQPIEHGGQPQPDHVYILPPNLRVTLKGSHFHLEGRADEVPQRPIDYFFRSLGCDQKSRSVGVILSGTDADGALGLKSIKGEGGITMVQSPESARFPEMPRSSISIDHVDRILSPDQLAVELANLARQFHEPAVVALGDGSSQPADEPHFNRILNLMRGVSGVDFRLYKPKTIRRRIARRMLLHRIQTLQEYAALLQSRPQELRELQEDALISVTRFFRDPQVFDALKQTVLPRIFADREYDQQVRVWVAGCSTGEEVYSIAMCLLEYLAGQPFEPSIQLFGTDASDRNIQYARAAIFSESVAEEVSPERLRRFFVKVEKGYQVSKRVRDLCIFARQNLCHDPPFSRMDLISCRNVLIYLGVELQKQILPMFHYALRPDGHLLLGSSETIREFTELFQFVDRKNKIFAKVNGAARPLTGGGSHYFQPDLAVLQPAVAYPENWSDTELQRAADRLVLARYGPPGVVINDKMEIVQSRGHTSPFIEMPQGAVTLQLTRMLRETVASQVVHAVRHAVEHGVPVRLESLRAPDGGQEQEFALEVLPIHTIQPRARCFLVLFVPKAPPAAVEGGAPEPVAASPEDSREPDHLVERLRQDLASTKLYLQTLLEERDARNQELVSANEEIQSANEEMQSTNEELETTKEELQSSNEELQTVNDELQQRNTVLTQTTNDLSNLLNSVNLPVLMLGSELNIRHFTPPTQRLMNLRSPDVGRPFTDIRLNLNVDNLEPLFNEVLETLAPKEIEMQDREGRWYQLRVRPYRTTENKIEGLVMVWVDVDQIRRTEQELRGARDFARFVIESVPLPLAVADMDLRVRSVNDAFRTLAGSGQEDLTNRSLLDIATAAWGLDEPLRSQLDSLRKAKDSLGSFEFEHRAGGNPVRVLNVRGRLLKPDGEMFLLVTLEEVTAHKEAERLLGVEGERLAGEVASTAQELGRTQQEVRALARSLLTTQEDERRRIARELHDDVCQRLAVLAFDAQQLESLMPGNPEQALGGLAQVRAGIDALSADVRLLSHTLHPAAIDDLGLPAALRALVAEFQEREHMITTFAAQDLPGNIPNNMATGLYRIAQEALRNTAKHAGRTHVKITLTGSPGRVRLQVSDSGEGFDTHAPRSGLGLVSMEERARMMEGTVTIDSKRGEGTRITVDVPLPLPDAT